MSDEAEKDYKKKLVVLVNNCMKHSHVIPLKEESSYEENPLIQNVLNGISVKLLDSMQVLIDRLDGKANISDKTERKTVDDKFNMIVEINDRILDRHNVLNQKLLGLSELKNSSNQTVQSIPDPTPTSNLVDQTYLKIQRSSTDNSNLPFKPLLTSKPNALVPLDVSLNQSVHPYKPEISRFEPSNKQLTKSCDPMFPFPSPLDETPYNFIETPEELSELMCHLKTCSEFAVDLEHNSHRSYMGMTCLLQISTRTHDFIVDTLKLYRHLEVLNEVFTDSKITKVLHGSKSDLSWLQRDFGVYIVNLFDTGVAAELLELPKRSLSYLLETYCSVTTDKRYQLADWRVRPLSKELIEYARIDTHYLLFIHQQLRETLFNDNLLEEHYKITKNMCQVAYKKPELNYGLVDSYTKQSNFNSRQKYALYRLWELRDTIARQLDESAEYVIGKRVLLNMAKTLPHDTSGILNCSSGDKKNSLLMKYKMDFLKVCLDAYQEKNVKSTNELSITQIETEFNNLANPYDKFEKVNSPKNVKISIKADASLAALPKKQPYILEQYNENMLQLYMKINPLPVKQEIRQRKLDGELDSVEIGQEEIQENDINMEPENVMILEETKGITLENLSQPIHKPEGASTSKWNSDKERKEMKTVNNVVPFDYKATMAEMRQKFCKRKRDNSDNAYKTKKFKMPKKNHK